jgi:tetratricopeptide (TPR) repeat protein
LKAIKYFEKAIETDNAQNLARKQIADLYFKQKNYTEAIKVYRIIHKNIKAIQCFELLIKNDNENPLIKE